MNSLTFLSRQFDALVVRVNGHRKLSSATEKVSSRIGRNVDGSSKRTKAWTAHPSDSPPGSNPELPHQNRKRSVSSPLETRTSSMLLDRNRQNNPIHHSALRYSLLIRRIHLHRVFTYLYDWLAAAWFSLKRLRISGATVTKVSIGDSDEKEDNTGLLVDEQRLPSDHNTPNASRFLPNNSRLVSPLSQFTVTPIVNLIPPDIPGQSDSTLAESSTVIVPPERVKSPSVGSDSISPSVPKTPFHLPKTLVLDLDETLIHSTTRPLFASQSSIWGFLRSSILGRRTKGTTHVVEVVLGGKCTSYHVYKRPFVDYFLRKVSGWYTLVIFTASMQEYADPVIDWLDAGTGILAKRLFRDSCTQLPNGAYSKDLSIIEEDLSRICLIDNSPQSYSRNQANGIPIEGWTQDPSDEALLDLLPVLDSLRFTSDVRRVLGIRGFS